MTKTPEVCANCEYSVYAEVPNQMYCVGLKHKNSTERVERDDTCDKFMRYVEPGDNYTDLAGSIE